MRAAVLVILGVTLVGCGSTAPWLRDQPSSSQPVQHLAEQTASGKPEVVIPGTTKKAVVDALASQMIREGYSIGKIDDYRAQFEKPGGFWLDLLAGSHFNSSAIWRISYSLLDSPEGVRVIAEMGAVTNPGSGFEKVTEVKGGKNAAAVQSILDAVRNETARVVVPPPAPPDSSARR